MVTNLFDTDPGCLGGSATQKSLGLSGANWGVSHYNLVKIPRHSRGGWGSQKVPIPEVVLEGVLGGSWGCSGVEVGQVRGRSWRSWGRNFRKISSSNLAKKVGQLGQKKWRKLANFFEKISRNFWRKNLAESWGKNLRFFLESWEFFSKIFENL